MTYIKVILFGVGMIAGVVMKIAIIDTQLSPQWQLATSMFSAIFLLTILACLAIKYKNAIKNAITSLKEL